LSEAQQLSELVERGHSFRSYKAQPLTEKIGLQEQFLEGKLPSEFEKTDIFEKSLACYEAYLESILGLRNRAEFGAVLKQWAKIWTKKRGDMEEAQRIVLEKRRNKQVGEMLSTISDKEAATAFRELTRRMIELVTCSPVQLKQLLAE
jgi:hypothetical protein